MRLSRAVVALVALLVPQRAELRHGDSARAVVALRHFRAPSDTLSVTVRGFLPRAIASRPATADSASDAAAERSASRIAVVLIPGPVGSAFSMRHITDALAAESVPTIVIDPLGMGTSSRPANADYTLTRQAVRIATILDTLQVDRALVVGQGTSASIALHLAADDTARVHAVLSLAGGPVEKQGTRGVRLALTLAPVLDNALGRAIGRKKFRNAVREQSASTTWFTDSVVRMYLGPYERDLKGSLRALRAMNDAVEPVALAVRLGAIRAPVRLLVGDKPSANAPTTEQIQLLRRSVARFSVDTIAKAGTMLQEERPDAVLVAIRELLRRPSQP